VVAINTSEEKFSKEGVVNTSKEELSKEEEEERVENLLSPWSKQPVVVKTSPGRSSTLLNPSVMEALLPLTRPALLILLWVCY
jgi:hypothetical protein